MIMLAGLEPDRDIPIVYTQPYPGEKLFEDILTAEEGTVASKHERIYVARTNGFGREAGPIDKSLERLQAAIGQDNPATILKALAEVVPNFNHTNGITQPGTGADLLLTTPLQAPQVPRSPVHFSNETGKQWQQIPK